MVNCSRLERETIMITEESLTFDHIGRFVSQIRVSKMFERERFRAVSDALDGRAAHQKCVVKMTVGQYEASTIKTSDKSNLLRALTSRKSDGEASESSCSDDGDFFASPHRYDQLTSAGVVPDHEEAVVVGRRTRDDFSYFVLKFDTRYKAESFVRELNVRFQCSYQKWQAEVMQRASPGCSSATFASRRSASS